MADIVLSNGMGATVKGYFVRFEGEVSIESTERGSLEGQTEFQLSKDDIERLAKLAGVIK